MYSMQRDLISKILELIDKDENYDTGYMFTNILGETVCTFKYDNKEYIITIEELEQERGE